MEPQRTCVGCRRRDDQSRLRRLVERDGRIVDGTRPRLEGRGAYVHAECLELAVSRKAVNRALRTSAPLGIDG